MCQKVMGEYDDGDLFRAMSDLTYYGGVHCTIKIVGGHAEETAVWVETTEHLHSFLIDRPAERGRLVRWAHAMRNRPANLPHPEPEAAE